MGSWDRLESFKKVGGERSERELGGDSTSERKKRAFLRMSWGAYLSSKGKDQRDRETEKMKAGDGIHNWWGWVKKQGVREGVKRDLQSDRNLKGSCLWTEYLSPKQWWNITAGEPQVWKEWPVLEADGQFHITLRSTISCLFSFYQNIFYGSFMLICMNYRFF